MPQVPCNTKKEPVFLRLLLSFFLLGFRMPVVQLQYVKNVFSPDGEYRMPDNADVIMEPSALFSSSYSDVRTESDYKQQLSKEVKHTAGFGIDGRVVYKHTTSNS